MLDLVGLDSVAGQRAGRFSLGMGQRLGIAAAMLGDPPVVVLDEPVNGLDPEGIRWVRTFARQLADEGRTVFVSSHLMSEMALMADHLVVIGRGRILADCSMPRVHGRPRRVVRPGARRPRSATSPTCSAAAALDVARVDDELRVAGLDAAGDRRAAVKHGLLLHELTLVRSSLEDAFMTLTADSVEYHADLPKEPTDDRDPDGAPGPVVERTDRTPRPASARVAARRVDQALARSARPGGRWPRRSSSAPA